MNIFSINQVGQVYVAKAYKANIAAFTTEGDTCIKSTPDGSTIYFQQLGMGGVVKSDNIDVKDIISGVATPAAKIGMQLHTSTVTLDATVNGGLPLAGQDYMLSVLIDNYIGISPTDSQYWKFGVVHAITGMTASDFYKKMAVSLATNMLRETYKFMKISLQTDTTPVEVTPYTKLAALTGTYTGIIVEEVAPLWRLGTMQQKVLELTVQPTTIRIDGADIKWGNAVKTKGAVVGNGKLMADYEYFFMGARGDEYRMVGFPNYVPTSYMVDPTASYDTISLHFAFVGDNDNSYKSEKDITLIVPAGGTKAFLDVLNPLILKSGVQIASITPVVP